MTSRIWAGSKRTAVPAAISTDSTQGYDRGLKFEKYRSIASFREYLLIAQDRPYVELHARAETHKWTMCEYTELTGVISLAAIDVSIQLVEIYRKIAFTQHARLPAP